MFPEKKVATLWGISSMKQLDARYAKRVRTSTAELIVYAKSMIKFIKEYSDAIATIGTVPNYTETISGTDSGVATRKPNENWN